MSQIIAHFFDSSYLFSIIGFLVTFKLAFDTNRIQEGVTMWVPLFFFVKNALASSLNICVSAATNIEQAAASFHLIQPLKQKKLFGTYPKVVNYLVMKSASDQARAKMDFANLRYTQQNSMSPMQYAEDLCAKSCKLADVYDESTRNDIFIKSVDA